MIVPWGRGVELLDQGAGFDAPASDSFRLASRGFFRPYKDLESGKIISGSPAIRDYTRITILVSIRFDAYYLIGHAVLPQARAVRNI